MKKLLLIAALGFLAVFQVDAQSKDQQHKKLQDKDVPQVVRTSFESQFDNTMTVEWKLKNGKYVAMFTKNTKKHIAEFSDSGELISKGEKIDKEELPSAVSDAFKTGYTTEKIDEVYKIEKEGQTQYKVKLEGNPKKVVIYDAQGKVLKEKTMQE